MNKLKTFKFLFIFSVFIWNYGSINAKPLLGLSCPVQYTQAHDIANEIHYMSVYNPIDGPAWVKAKTCAELNVVARSNKAQLDSKQKDLADVLQNGKFYVNSAGWPLEARAENAPSSWGV